MLKIKILPEFDEQSFENLENNIPYLSENIISFSIDKKNKQINIETKEVSLEPKVEAQVIQLINKLKPIRSFETKTYFDHLTQEVPCHEDIFKKLINKKDIYEISPGLYSISGLPMQMMESFELQIKKLAKTFAARETLYPISTRVDDLKKAHFFKRTPQHANFISLLSEGSENISDFAKMIETADAKEIYSHFETPTHICRSAICSNSYPSYKNKVFAENETIALTTVGRAFRNESKNVTSLERLHEFSMREIIFLGDKDYVAKSLQKCTDWFKNFMLESNLKGVIKTAGDAFYADNLQALQFYQMAEQSKLEFRLVNPFSGREISCGSINSHGNHFSKSYDMKLSSGGFAFSGCVGFGYERTIFLVLSQYGLNPQAWPKFLQKFFGL